MKIGDFCAAVVLLGLACGPQLAEATLGQGQTSVETDRLSFGAVRRTADGASGNGVTGSEAVGQRLSGDGTSSNGISRGGAPNDAASRGAAAAMRTAFVGAFSMQEMALTDGTAVREYVDAAGVVFGVAWDGTSIPPLAQLLGEDLLAKTRAAFETERAKRATRGPVSIETRDIVFHSGGHPQAFFGNAYLPQRMPAGVSPADIR